MTSVVGPALISVRRSVSDTRGSDDVGARYHSRGQSRSSRACHRKVDYRSDDAPSALAKSLRDTGFVVVTNHPIDVSRIDGLYAKWRDFFASEQKFDYLFDPSVQDGYFPFRTENAKSSPTKDLKEFYHVYPHGRVPSTLAVEIRAFYTQMVTFGQTLLGWVAENSPVEVRERFSDPLDEMVHNSARNLLRVLHYPPLGRVDAEPGAVRAAAHEDINLITLLVSGSTPHLQALDALGEWHDVPCDAGMITVNCGDMLQMASGGYFPSTTHRVVNPPRSQNVSRYSMPMFVQPRPNVRLGDGYTAEDYLQERLKEIGLET